MRAKKMHYIVLDDEENGVCGTYGNEEEDFDNLTMEKSFVSCTRCLSWIAKNEGTEVAKTPEKIVFEVTDDIKRALKLIGQVGGRWADRTNQCRTYDEAIAHINSKLPEGAYIPSRLTTWLVEISNKTGAVTVETVSKTEAEALQLVKNQTRYFGEEIGNKFNVKVVGKVE